MSITPNDPADFTPSMGAYKTLQPFRYWCQKVLPLVYDDSLSYYELLCKVVDYLNKTMEDVETLHEDVDGLHSAYVNLQEFVNTSYTDLINFVNNYFDNLDVQEEINNKLDTMASDGTLDALLLPYFNEYKQEINATVGTQNQRITILEGRMNEFASLPDGSTSGDAELIDIRVGGNGITYPSAGDAVRGQFGELEQTIEDFTQEFVNGKTSEIKTITPTLSVNKAILKSNGEVVSNLTNTFACCEDYIDIKDVTAMSGFFFGYGIYGCAYYDANKIFISSGSNVTNITKDDIPTNARYFRFTDYVAAGTHSSRPLDMTYEYAAIAGMQSMIDKSIKKNGKRFAHISFDDCIFWDDLTQNENVYESCFENTFLSVLKAYHDNYGCVFSCFCFIQNGANSISNVTNKFASEFAENKDWLKFGFHGTTVSETFDNTEPSVVAGYYNTFVSAIYQMTGDYECIDRVTRLSSFSGSEAVCVALRDCDLGVRGLLGAETGRSYYLGADDYAYLNKQCKFYDETNQLTFIHTITRLENSSMNVNVLNNIVTYNHLPVWEFFSHQDQFVASIQAKLTQICEWLIAHDFTFEFSEYALNI